jgi:periplasmic copper chaperone A
MSRSNPSRSTRLLAATAAAATILLTVVSVASAHIIVDPGEAAKGSFTKLAFRVANERDDAGTTTFEVNFPTDHPIAFLSVRPRPGWTYEVERTQLDEPIDAEGEELTEVVSKVTWTGGPISAGEFDDFEVSAGPLPEDVDELVFPSLQTYDDGEVVRWIDPTPPGGEEPEHPAPVLRLVDAADEAAEETTTSATTAERTATDGVALSNVASQDDVDSTQTLAIIALIVGALGLIAGLFAFLRCRTT